MKYVFVQILNDKIYLRSYNEMGLLMFRSIDQVYKDKLEIKLYSEEGKNDFTQYLKNRFTKNTRFKHYAIKIKDEKPSIEQIKEAIDDLITLMEIIQ